MWFVLSTNLQPRWRGSDFRYFSSCSYPFVRNVYGSRSVGSHIRVGLRWLCTMAFHASWRQWPASLFLYHIFKWKWCQLLACNYRDAYFSIPQMTHVKCVCPPICPWNPVGEWVTHIIRMAKYWTTSYRFLATLPLRHQLCRCYVWKKLLLQWTVEYMVLVWEREREKEHYDCGREHDKIRGVVNFTVDVRVHLSQLNRN